MERQDRRRNRAALIRAARKQMLADGMNAPTRTIARVAGLGTATLYRHFPTRVDLFVAVFGPEIDQCRAKLSVGDNMSDPWDALVHLLRTVAETERSVPGLAASLSQAGSTFPAYDALWAELHVTIDTLVARLRRSGARADLRRRDLWLLLEAVRSTTAARGTKSSDAKRLISLLVEGLR